MTRKVDQEFGERLSRLLEEPPFTGMTGRDIAKRLGVTEPMLSNYRSGKKLPAMKKAILLAIKLNVCVDWLLTGRGAKRPGAPNPDEDGNTITFDMTGIPSEQHGKFAQALHAFAQQVREVMASYK